MPSTWEGFGNPVLESVTHRRPLALYPYPVACEIRDFGFRFFDLGDVAAIKSFVENPDYELYAHNLAIALGALQRGDASHASARPFGFNGRAVVAN
jgi:hypothetical protein